VKVYSGQLSWPQVGHPRPQFMRFVVKKAKGNSSRIIQILSYNSGCLSTLLRHSSQTANGTSDRNGTGCRQRVGTSRNGLTARTATPDSSVSSLDGILSAKHTAVCRVLRDLNLSHQLSKSRTISGSIFSSDSHLLGTLSHFELKKLV
jgi:hypothetical protein